MSFRKETAPIRRRLKKTNAHGENKDAKPTGEEGPDKEPIRRTYFPTRRRIGVKLPPQRRRGKIDIVRSLGALNPGARFSLTGDLRTRLRGYGAYGAFCFVAGSFAFVRTARIVG